MLIESLPLTTVCLETTQGVSICSVELSNTPTCKALCNPERMGRPSFSPELELSAVSVCTEASTV